MLQQTTVWITPKTVTRVSMTLRLVSAKMGLQTIQTVMIIVQMVQQIIQNVPSAVTKIQINHNVHMIVIIIITALIRVTQIQTFLSVQKKIRVKKIQICPSARRIHVQMACSHFRIVLINQENELHVKR